MRFPKGIWVYGDKKFTGVCALEKHEIRTFFVLLRHAHPQLGLIAFHARNEGKRPGWRGTQHKLEGMVTGVSDIMIPGCPSFVCELKRRDHTKSEITKAQIDYLQACKTAGSFVCIALGADAAIEAVGKWLEYSRKLSMDRPTRTNGHGETSMKLEDRELERAEAPEIIYDGSGEQHNPYSVKPYLLQQVKDGKWVLKIGTWGNGPYGGTKRWTLVDVYDSLRECIDGIGKKP